MILPTKHLPIERSLVSIGADIVTLLKEPQTVSSLWYAYKNLCEERNLRISFDWFTLAVAMLHAIGAVEQQGRRLSRRELSE